MTAGRVEAAGGIPHRRRDGRDEILLVHRPRYDDWSFPKGKLDPGETFEDAAVREVEEETGLRCRLGDWLADVEYQDARGRPKVVRYWLLEVVHDGGLDAGDEVDERRWVTLADAVALLSYERDVEVARAAAEAIHRATR